MSLEQAKTVMHAALALRDAIKKASTWEDIPEKLSLCGISLSEIAKRLKPKIGFDPHSHTVHSDGIFTHKQVVWWAKAIGLAGVGITDHDNISSDFGDAIDEAERLGVHLVPGLEYTVNRLGGQSWKGLELNMHFFPARKFADFIRSEAGAQFRRRFEKINRNKSEQGWGALERVNEQFMHPRGLSEITRDELWNASGRTDPVCPSTLTVIIIERFFSESRVELLKELPDTRAIYTYMGRNGLVPAMDSEPQSLDGMIEIREELARAGIKSTVTLNHPEEWLTKCGLVDSEGAPDLPAIRRLVALILLHEPRRLPVSFIELYSPRNTPETRPIFMCLLSEFEELRKTQFPQLNALEAIASTDSHRVLGFLDAAGEVQGWVPGEDFLWGMGKVDAESPSGNLCAPEDYPSGTEMMRRMEERAS